MTVNLEAKLVKPLYDLLVMLENGEHIKISNPFDCKEVIRAQKALAEYLEFESTRNIDVTDKVKIFINNNEKEDNSYERIS